MNITCEELQKLGERYANLVELLKNPSYDENYASAAEKQEFIEYYNKLGNFFLSKSFEIAQKAVKG
jgi:hypothetical protein